MVKPWIPSRSKTKKDESSSGSTRIGTRALRTSTFGTNLLASLRQRIVRRPKPAAIPEQSLDEVPLAPVMAPTAPTGPVLSYEGKQPTAPKPPPGSDDEWSDESEDENVLGQDGLDGGAVVKKPKKIKTSNRPSLGFNRWVPKLLDPVEKHRDRVYRKKKKFVFSAHKRSPAIFTDSRPPYIALLARVLEFLDPFEPARVAAYVNKATSVGVKAFYNLYYPPPRPRRYLVNRTLENHQSVYLAKVMELLPIEDRVRASTTCKSFYEACNSLPLEFIGVRAVQDFLARYEFPRSGRIHKRFKKTPALLFNEAHAEDVVNIIHMLERGGDDEDDDPDDDTDCFASVQKISLRKVRGFSTAKGKYFQKLLQTLFMDHVNSRLQTLELIDLELEDLQFKHLAKLWRDARFPVLRHLSLANNAFSSRYVRDWSFDNDQFLTLEEIDVSNTEMTNHDLQRLIDCLSTTPALKSLTLSHNLFSFETVHKLREQIESKALSALRELHCVAITADEVAIGHLIEIFQKSTSCCPHLQVLDVHGNPLSNPKAATQLARVFTSRSDLSSGWPELTSLNISSMQLGDDGLRTIATAILDNQATRIQHLDISDNGIGSSIDVFVRALAAHKLSHLRSLVIADNALGALEFEALSSTLISNCCPRLEILDLSANFARGEGIARFCPFLLSPPAQHLWALDLSDNEIPHRGLLRLNETLARGNCIQLHELNLSRNAELKAIVSFLDLIRGNGLPSLTVLQVGCAQSRSEGHDLVKDTLRRRSVQELRRLKQLRFEEKLTATQLENNAKAERAQIRCRRQSQRLREVYDHLENEADRALCRRKQVKKASQLHIYQEIMRQKQQHDHVRLCRKLDLDVHAA